jgi:hypothetical protein
MRPSPPGIHTARLWPLLFLALLPFLVLLGCSRSPQPAQEASVPPWFADVTEEVGLDFVHDPGAVGSYFMPQSMGSGCAFVEEEDGTLYLYLLHNGGPDSKSRNRLYRRRGGTFTDVSSGSGLDVAGFGMGVAVGDVNNDGHPDVLLSEYGRIRLFLNRGGGRFEDATSDSGLFNPLWATSALFFDFDRDGWLDLLVVNYKDYDPKRECYSPRGLRTFCGPNNFPDSCSKLFRNLSGKSGGKETKFEDVSFASGIGRLAGPGLGVVAADLNGDGWADLFVANDGEPNRLWINQKDGTFADEAVSRGVAFTALGKAFAGMGVTLGDIDNDGLLDLYVTHLTSESNTLWRQGPPGLFRDRTVESALASTRWRGTGFGTLLADFDLDGDLDLALVNGRAFRGGEARDTELGFWETYAERNQVLGNDGTGKFRDLSASNPALCGAWNVARGLAAADVDGDGAPELLLSVIGGRARLLRNVAEGRGHWLKVRALDPALRRDALGAEVRVRAANKQWLRLVSPAGSYLSSSSVWALFGLGNTNRVDTIEVRWPDGSREVFPGGAADRALVLRKGEGRSP